MQTSNQQINLKEVINTIANNEILRKILGNNAG